MKTKLFIMLVFVTLASLSAGQVSGQTTTGVDVASLAVKKMTLDEVMEVWSKNDVSEYLDFTPRPDSEYYAVVVTFDIRETASSESYENTRVAVQLLSEDSANAKIVAYLPDSIDEKTPSTETEEIAASFTGVIKVFTPAVKWSDTRIKNHIELYRRVAAHQNMSNRIEWTFRSSKPYPILPGTYYALAVVEMPKGAVGIAVAGGCCTVFKPYISLLPFLGGWHVPCAVGGQQQKVVPEEAAMHFEAKPTMASCDLMAKPLVPVCPTDTAPIKFDWEVIPAGSFKMGSDPKQDGMAPLSEQPQDSVYVNTFCVAPTEVTVAQFAEFVADQDYQTTAEKEGRSEVWNKEKKVWETVVGASWRAPLGPGSNVDQKQNHPVTHVSWEDAQRFSDWAGVRLLTEEEWEKAARGTEGWIYPWGDNRPDKSRCNFNMNEGDTTEVGHYPAGANKLYDMAGNVFEWTQTKESENGRVVRGGDFGNNEIDVRCAARYAYYPLTHHQARGFRVAVDPSFH